MRINLRMVVGIPGCGKSTFIEKRIENYNTVHISRDKVRFSLLTENDDYFAKENETWKQFIANIQKAIDDGIENIYIDATHISERARNKVFDALKLNSNVDIHLIYFDVPINVCLDRNFKRIGLARVPDSAVYNMYHSLTKPTFQEKYRYASISIIDENGLMVDRKVASDV